MSHLDLVVDGDGQRRERLHHVLAVLGRSLEADDLVVGGKVLGLFPADLAG